MNPFKKDEIVILLGAGASVDAGLLHSQDMARKIETLVNEEWSEYQALYNYIKSSIYFADGIRGRFDARVNYNIERIVNTLDELTRKEEHPLYPFLGSWNPKLLEVAGPDFDFLREFRRKIVERLRDKWITLEYKEMAAYYNGLVEFQAQYQYPLRVFSLNYDLCVEEYCNSGSLERGFENKIWDWRLFELEDKNIYLYKLHGSTDWVREEGQLTYKSSASQIDHDQAEMIFGSAYKLQYVDPFLFFAYELRKWTLGEAKLIISIGYGFGDEHINAILGQALNSSNEKILLSVAPVAESSTTETAIQEIKSTLDIRSSSQIECFNLTAKEFMEKHLDIAKLANELIPEEPELFPEIISSNSNE